MMLVLVGLREKRISQRPGLEAAQEAEQLNELKGPKTKRGAQLAPRESKDEAHSAGSVASCCL